MSGANTVRYTSSAVQDIQDNDEENPQKYATQALPTSRFNILLTRSRLSRKRITRKSNDNNNNNNNGIIIILTISREVRSRDRITRHMT